MSKTLETPESMGLRLAKSQDKITLDRIVKGQQDVIAQHEAAVADGRITQAQADRDVAYAKTLIQTIQNHR